MTKTSNPFLLSCFTILICVMNGCEQRKTASSPDQQKLFVYSSRKAHLIQPLFELFQQHTGIRVELITDKAGPLITRLENEQHATPADIFMTVDAGMLWLATQKQLFLPFKSPVLAHNIPAHLRDRHGQWFGLSTRARALVYAKNRVNFPADFRLADLAESEWRNRLCLRTSNSVYNQSLVATMIARHGEEQAAKLLSAWVDNLAVAPFANDTQAIKAVMAGRCDVALVNSYYYGRIQRDYAGDNFPLAIFWPDQAQGQSGVHINISGAGITRHAKNVHNAQKLLEWLSEPPAQKLFAELNMEFPVNSQAPQSLVVNSWGNFRADTTHLEVAGQLQPAAIKTMDRAGWK